MGLREEIEAAFGEAAAQGGVRVLAIDGDEEVWVGGLAATDGTLEVRVGDRGPRRGLRPAVDALASGAEEVAFVSRVAGPNAVSMVAVGGRIRVEVLWPSDEPLELRASTSTATRSCRCARSSPTRPSPPPGPPSTRSGSTSASPSSPISVPERPSALLVIPPA